MKNTFFLKDAYETEIDLETNEDVLERIYSDNISDQDKCNINFAFITDTIEKANCFAKALSENYTAYKGIQVEAYDNLFEITGLSDPIQMAITPINNWNKVLWDLGYQYDCRLDGWFVEGK